MGKQSRLDMFFRQDSSGKKTTEIMDKNTTISSLSDMIKEFKSKIKLPEIRDTISKRYSIGEITSKAKKILVVTEKPKVAQAIAKALGSGKARSIKSRSRSLIVYDVNWNNKKITIIPLRGHIIEYAPIDRFSGKWEESDPRQIINPSSLREIVTEKLIAEVLSAESRNADLLLLATDADEEGANIGLEAYEIVRKQRKDIPVYQMWFISLQPTELRTAFNKPIEPKWNWAYAVKARRIIDAMIGFSATRELTVAFREVTKSLRIKALSIGRVQTPTLYLLFLREREIKNFKPKPYWVLRAQFQINGSRAEGQHIDSPFWDEERAKNVFSRIRDARRAVVKEVHVSKESKLPPTPLDTTKALAMINNILGIPSSRAMKILEDLYLNGLITYPRTDTDKYPETYNHIPNLRALQKIPTFSSIVRDIFSKGAKLRRNGTRLVGDHLPITPIDAATPGDKRLPTQQHAMVYDLIVRRYLSLFLEPAEIIRFKALIAINSELFEFSGTRILKSGFYIVYPYDKPKESIYAEIFEGQEILVEKVFPPEKRYTQPPPRLKESDLIKIMETLGLGTKSTRPDHIETLISRRYVERKGKTLRITSIGWILAEFLEQIWPDFVKPFFSAYVHAWMRKVMNGEIHWQEMVRDVQEKFLSLFDELRKNITNLKGKLLKVSKEYAQKNEIMKCPRCNSSVIAIPSKKAKVNILKCTHCDFSTIVPKATKYVAQEIKCSICHTNVLLLKRRGKADIYLCPICWRTKGICSKCDHLEYCDMKKILEKEREKTIVGKCDCGGKLIYLVNWRVVKCDNCNQQYHLPKRGSIKLLKKTCPICQKYRLLRIKTAKSTTYYCIKCGIVK
ncbi:MAG: DNA topoisomerase [Candidatus Njordarchaeales archaeon]